LLGDLVGHVEHGDVDVVEDLRRQGLHLDLLTADGQALAGRSRRGDEADLAPDVLAGGEDVQHHGADGAGGADDGQGGAACTHRPVPPYTTASTCAASSWNSEWAAATAVSIWSWSTATEMRISEVEIISMLVPDFAR